MAQVRGPINANTEVLGFYHKQKSEFHFNEKTDNEFLMFLLDTAVRVISIGWSSNNLIYFKYEF